MSFFKDKTILVTGAGGSIGSVLCEQLMTHGPKTLILFDSSELALYNIDRKLEGRAEAVLGDVSNRGDVWSVFDENDIDIVFHAAAYKHVTMCEKNEEVAYRVNALGTSLVANAAARRQVPRLILISTDKAVRPTCVMGRSKQAAEGIVRQLKYTTVRLGNVYGSSGSVVPLWKEQIANGEPVTITHPSATRYFITANKAAHAILKAAEYANGTFVPTMGDPLSVVELAQHLGAKDIKYIGLRPGEKLHEELFVGARVVTCEPGLWQDAA
jgi:FlaA1/EpsC-like NDP-sugar epimerase